MTNVARRILSLGALLAAASLTACSGTPIGTDAPDSGSSRSPGSSGSAPTEGDPTATKQPTSGTGGAEPTAPAASTYDALFGPPSSTTVTPGSLVGLWAGTMSNTNDDLRLQISGSKIVAAIRCSFGSSTTATVGAEISAVVSTSMIRIVESKTVGTGACKIVIQPRTIPRCTTDSDFGCFTVSGTSLHFSDAPLFSSNASDGPDPLFTKLSD